MLSRSKLLVDMLNNNLIPWVIYKGKYHYADGFSGEGDADIFINEKSISQAHDILDKSGFVRFNTQSYYKRPGVEDWIGFDESTGKLIHVHLHTRIVFGNSYVEQYRFKLENECLRLADIDKNGIRSQNAILESILVLCMFAKKSIGIDKLEKYRGGVRNSVVSGSIKQTKLAYLTNEDKIVINKFIDGSIDNVERLHEFADKFCEEEISNWKWIYYKRLLAHKISRWYYR